ncbi:MAG: hypothetical protein SFX74_04780 [Fimbriimonadaceae bacterium]|nr:hypothetical protein [Fimbriimonadaceae bacterium]
MSAPEFYRKLREMANISDIYMKPPVPTKAEIRNSLRACKTCLEFVAWMEKYTYQKKYWGY